MSTRVSGVVQRLAENMLPLANYLALEIFAKDLDLDVEASNKLASLLKPYTMYRRVSEIGQSNLKPTQSIVTLRCFSNVTLPNSQKVEEDKEAEDKNKEDEKKEEGKENTGASAKKEEEESKKDTGASAEKACSSAVLSLNLLLSNQQALFLFQANKGCSNYKSSSAIYSSILQNLLLQLDSNISK